MFEVRNRNNSFDKAIKSIYLVSYMLVYSLKIDNLFIL